MDALEKLIRESCPSSARRDAPAAALIQGSAGSSLDEGLTVE
jgi:hypothetical protein